MVGWVRGLCSEGFGDESREGRTDVGAVETSSTSVKEEAVRLIDGIDRVEDWIERGELEMLLSGGDAAASLIHIGMGRRAGGRACRDTVRSLEELH